jgi:hypothetical protein
MTASMLLFQACFLALLCAMLVRSVRANHALIGLAGIAGIFMAAGDQGAMEMLAPFLVALVALVQVGSRLLADRRAKFSADEEAMLTGPLTGLTRARARHFLDQGFWMAGRTGDVLTREGETVGQLYYLASGEAKVVSHGHMVGTLRSGQLIGEATILSADAATATVTLTKASRFWCAPSKTLNAYLATNDDVRHVLEHGFNQSLREKLHAMNRASAAQA